MAKKIEVFLLQPLAGRGNAGEFITVAPSYAVNVLIPNGKAKIADKQMHNQRDMYLKRIAKEKAERQAVVKNVLETLKTSGITIEKQATENDGLYDTVDAKSLAVYVVTHHNISLDPKNIHLEHKIETLGSYEFTITYEDLVAKIALHIVRKS